MRQQHGERQTRMIFLNSCCELETDLTPQELLLACQNIEKELKRVRHEHWGPRTIDIDILLYGNETIATENLSVPHPYMTDGLLFGTVRGNRSATST